MRISRYIFTSSLLLLLPFIAIAQETKTEEKEGLFAFKGVSVGADLFGYMSTVFNEYSSGELGVSVNLGNRFFPTVEIGYGSTDHTDELTQIYYKSSAPYYRVGLDYNFLHKKKGKLSGYKIFAIGRYGWTSPKYSLKTAPIIDPVWGSSSTLEVNNAKSSCAWFEIGAGIQVRIWKNLHMGWSIRYKTRLKDEKGNQSQIWYIPGYGENKSSNFGGTYTIIYDLPIGKKNNE